MGHIFWNERIKLIDSGEMVDVLAIGDSWFHYPFNNLITPLHAALARPTIYVIGENGARADELSTGAWLASFRAMLDDYPTIRLVAISAGGNDFAGIGDLDAKVLAADCSGAAAADACFRAGQPDGVFADVGNAYRVLLSAVGAVRPAATVLVHNYDYAIPDGRTLPGLRSWLKLPMDNCRVPLAGAPTRWRATRHRARAHRSLHALSRRPRDGACGTRCAGGRSRLVGGNPCRFGMGQ